MIEPASAARDGLRAGGLALVWLYLFFLAPPGWDLVSSTRSFSRAELEEIEGRWGAQGAAVAVEVARVDATYRQPLLPSLSLPLRPIRAVESWALFTRSRNYIRRLEIEVDGRILYRSASTKRDWHVSSLRNRHLRPFAEMFARGQGATYRRAYADWILAQVLAERPGAQGVTIRGTRASYPDGKAKLHNGLTASAPAWHWVELER